MVHEVIKQYNNYSSMKTNQKLMKLMGEELKADTYIYKCSIYMQINSSCHSFETLL